MFSLWTDLSSSGIQMKTGLKLKSVPLTELADHWNNLNSVVPVNSKRLTLLMPIDAKPIALVRSKTLKDLLYNAYVRKTKITV